MVTDATRHGEYATETLGLLLASKDPASTLPQLQQFLDNSSKRLFGSQTVTPRPASVSGNVRHFVLLLLLKQAVADGVLGMVTTNEFLTKNCSEWALQTPADLEFTIDGIPTPDGLQLYDLWETLQTHIPKPLRLELCQWCLGLLSHALILEHHHQYPRPKLSKLALVEYSKAFYTKRQLKYLDVTYGIVV